MRAEPRLESRTKCRCDVSLKCMRCGKLHHHGVVLRPSQYEEAMGLLRELGFRDKQLGHLRTPFLKRIREVFGA